MSTLPRNTQEPNGISHAERLEFFREEELKRRATMKLSTKLIEPGISTSVMLDCAIKLQGHNYDDVVEERSSQKLCGYPPCIGTTLNAQGKSKHGVKGGRKFMIDATQHLVVSAEKLGQFCSQRCWKASDKYKVQLPAQYRDLVVLDAPNHPAIAHAPKDQVVAMVPDGKSSSTKQDTIASSGTEAPTVFGSANSWDTQNTKQNGSDVPMQATNDTGSRNTTEPWIVVERRMENLTLNPNHSSFPKAGDVEAARKVEGYESRTKKETRKTVSWNTPLIPEEDILNAAEVDLAPDLDCSSDGELEGDDTSSMGDSESDFGGTFMDLSSVKDDIELEAMSLSVFQMTWEAISEWVTPNTRSVLHGTSTSASTGSSLEQAVLQHRVTDAETKDVELLQTGQVEQNRTHIVTQSLLPQFHRVLDAVNAQLNVDGRPGVEKNIASLLVREIVLTMDFVRTIPSLVTVHWKSLAIVLLYSIGESHPDYDKFGICDLLEGDIEDDVWKTGMSVHQIRLLSQVFISAPCIAMENDVSMKRDGTST